MKTDDAQGWLCGVRMLHGHAPGRAISLHPAGAHSAGAAVEHPDATQPPLSIVGLQNEALSVSGITGKSFFDEAGIGQGHVIDPRTGRPTQAARVKAVVCKSATVSDAWATALLVDPSLKLPEGLRPIH